MAKVDLRENEYMERFVGPDHVDSNDAQFWYQLLSCSFNFMRVQDQRTVEKTLSPYIFRLTQNNSQSLNIGSLLRVFLDRVSKIKMPSGQSTNAYYVFQTFNALYLLRTTCKSYVESLSEDHLISSLRAKVDVPKQALQALNLPKPPSQYQQPAQSPTNLNTLSDGKPQVSNGNLADPHDVNIVQQSTIEADSSTVQDIANSAQDNSRKADYTPGSTMLDQFISSLIAIIVDIPPIDSAYLLQVESINALLVLLSVQMHSTIPANQSIIYTSLMQKKCSIHSLILTKTLLNNFIGQRPIPQDTGSIIIGLASGLWKVLTLGYGGQEEQELEDMPLLAKQSLLLLNVLTNHNTTSKNPYREAITSCQDSNYTLSDPLTAIENANNDALATAATSRSALTSNSIKVNFADLYGTICNNLHHDQVAPLLYLLLHRNKIFKPYVLTTASSELDKLLLPLLKILYSSIEKGSHHVYMVLIIFVILSEQASFNEAIHRLTIHGVPWHKDRLLNDISLGSLAALIIIRSIQYNTFRVKDKYLHSNLFATLANLSSYFHDLHPYVCQRIVGLLERLTKRYQLATKSNYGKQTSALDKSSHTLEVLDTNNPLAKALATDTHKQVLQDASSIELNSTFNDPAIAHGNHETINMNILDQSTQATGHNDRILPPVDVLGHEYAISENSDQQSQNANSTADYINIPIEDSRQDIGLIEEVIRMILVVINNTLSTQLKRNPDFIYTLLYKRGVFSSLLSSNQAFYDIVINIERVLTFFYNKIETFERPPTATEIKNLIQISSEEWNYDQNIDPSSMLLFRYKEDEPEEFFIPYIWTRIYYSSGIAWNSKRIVLFNPDHL